MRKRKLTTNAVEILEHRYTKEQPERKQSVRAERLSGQIAQMNYELRTDAGLSQKDLARLVGTTQSVISWLEDADYDGHSLVMLDRIARALNKTLTLSIA